MTKLHYTNEVSLRNFQHLDVQLVPEQKAVWLYFKPQPRPCFTMTLLGELAQFQSVLKHHDGKLHADGEAVAIEYNIISSRDSVFNFGGDLEYFIRCIETRDRNALKTYARLAIDAVYYNHIGRELDITTISLVHGDALGGGFEAALSSHVLIAEEQAEFGLPEVLFNLFPGMGAYNLLSQRLCPAEAERLILSGRRYSAEEMYVLGVVDTVVPEGMGISAVDQHIRMNRNRGNSLKAINRVRNLVHRLDYKQLLEIGDIWVDAAFRLGDKELRIMKYLVRNQQRFAVRDTMATVQSAMHMS